MENILDNLNAEQREAVQTVEGPLLVLAVREAEKLNYLPRDSLFNTKLSRTPRNILAVTFTIKLQRR